MPVTKVSFHPPRDFEAEKVEVREGVVDVVPVQLGRNAYTIVGHVVVEMEGGAKRAGKIEVNPANGEMRITRLTKAGEKEAAKPRPADPNNQDGPRQPGVAVAGPLTARPDVVAAEAKAPAAKDPLAKHQGGGKQ